MVSSLDKIENIQTFHFSNEHCKHSQRASQPSDEIIFLYHQSNNEQDLSIQGFAFPIPKKQS